MKQTVLIILLCMSAAILYGIVHNQVTVRISLEYFTIGHRALISSTSPTLMGIAWGVHPNWWVGLSMGVLLAMAGRVGKWPKRNARSLVKPLLLLFLISGMASATAGILGYRMTESGALRLYDPLFSQVPSSGHAAYISALWMHTASYTVGTMGALIVSLLVFTGRIRAGRA
ncbi:MAG: hypothetical protein U9P42_00320 [Candidatus Fermentibacteria bacterium]|nr:hypothetical protein [Candidatus Fermentibacteria bacterium]